NASAATDTGCCCKGFICLMLIDGQIVCILRIAGIDRDITTGLDDAIEGAAIYHQVLDHRKGLCTPGFYDDGIPVLIGTHMQLAGCGLVPWTMRLTVDVHRTGAADPFAAIVIECDRFLAF